jgi:hypothetical protein
VRAGKPASFNAKVESIVLANPLPMPAPILTVTMDFTATP